MSQTPRSVWSGNRHIWLQPASQRCYPSLWISAKLCCQPAHSLLTFTAGIHASVPILVFLCRMQYVLVNTAVIFFFPHIVVYVIVFDCWQQKHINPSSSIQPIFADAFTGRTGYESTERLIMWNTMLSFRHSWTLGLLWLCVNCCSHFHDLVFHGFCIGFLHICLAFKYFWSCFLCFLCWSSVCVYR